MSQFKDRHEQAIAEIKRSRELDPLALITNARKLVGNGSTEPVWQTSYALAKSGKRAEAITILNELKSRASESYVPAYCFAMIYNGLGEKDEALKYLEMSFEQREVQLTFANIDTRWDNLRSEPRFIELMKKMNL